MKSRAVVVLSGGSNETTDKRIEKGLELFKKYKHEGYSPILILSGFNTRKEHDKTLDWEFEGDWQDDFRLGKFVKYIEPLVKEGRAGIVYARNTVENASSTIHALKNFSIDPEKDLVDIVSSDYHINGDVPRIYSRFDFFRHNKSWYNLTFVPIRDNTPEDDRLSMEHKETLGKLLSYWLLLGTRHKNSKEIVNKYNRRRYNGLLGKLKN